MCVRSSLGGHQQPERMAGRDNARFTGTEQPRGKGNMDKRGPPLPRRRLQGVNAGDLGVGRPYSGTTMQQRQQQQGRGRPFPVEIKKCRKI